MAAVSKKRSPSDEDDKSPGRREQIMKAAIAILAERGFHQTKIHDIALAAGVADGTIYLYFKNKDQLLIQLFEEVMQRVLTIFRDALSRCSSPETKLRTFLHTHLTMVEHEPQIAQIISVELRQSSTFIKEYKNPLFAEYLSLIREILEEGQALGVFRPDLNLSLINRAVFGAMDEIALAWLLSSRRQESSLDFAADQLAALLLSGCRNPAPSEAHRGSQDLPTEDPQDSAP